MGITVRSDETVEKYNLKHRHRLRSLSLGQRAISADCSRSVTRWSRAPQLLRWSRKQTLRFTNGIGNLHVSTCILIHCHIVITVSLLNYFVIAIHDVFNASDVSSLFNMHLTVSSRQTSFYCSTRKFE